MRTTRGPIGDTLGTWGGVPLGTRGGVPLGTRWGHVGDAVTSVTGTRDGESQKPRQAGHPQSHPPNYGGPQHPVCGGTMGSVGALGSMGALGALGVLGILGTLWSSGMWDHHMGLYGATAIQCHMGPSYGAIWGHSDVEPYGAMIRGRMGSYGAVWGRGLFRTCSGAIRRSKASPRAVGSSGSRASWPNRSSSTAATAATA